MEKEWFVLLGVLLGAGLTTVKDYFQHRRQTKFEDRKLVIQRMEQLHEDAITYNSFLVSLPGRLEEILALSDRVQAIEKGNELIDKVKDPIAGINSKYRLYLDSDLTVLHEISVQIKVISRLIWRNVHERNWNTDSVTVKQDTLPIKDDVKKLMKLCESLVRSVETRIAIVRSDPPVIRGMRRATSLLFKNRPKHPPISF